METVTIEYYCKNVYGNKLNFLADTNQANGFRMMTGRKTFTTKDQRGLSALMGKIIEWKEVLEPRMEAQNA